MNYNYLKLTYSLRLNNESDDVQRISCGSEFQLSGAITVKMQSRPIMLIVETIA